MELLRASDGEVWGSYEHPYWNRYAAVLHKKEASSDGSATYIGCFLESAGFHAILQKVAGLAKIDLPQAAFPVIVKRGQNTLGEEVIYYFNYSMEPQHILHEFESGRELLSDTPLQQNEIFTLEPWGVRIVAVLPPKGKSGKQEGEAYS